MMNHDLETLLTETYRSLPVPHARQDVAVMRGRARLTPESRRWMRLYWAISGLGTLALLTGASGWQWFAAAAAAVTAGEAMRVAGWDLARLVRTSLALIVLLAGIDAHAADKALDDAMSSWRAAAMVGGEMVWSGSSAGAPDSFPVYSVAKPWTAAAAARLVELRKLDPRAAVQRYVPTFPEKPEGVITPMHLATHTSGIRHYRGAEASMTDCRDLAATIAVFRDDPLLFAPGDRQSYSTWGFVLLSAVIESAAAQPFEEAMKNLVFTRAAMKSTRLRQDLKCKWGGGGFVSTPEDLARFYDALLNQRLLASAELTKLVLNAREDEVGIGGTGDEGRAYVYVDLKRKIIVAITGVPRTANVDLPAIAREIARRQT